MKSIQFDRKKHIYKSEAFVELVKDAVRFFNGTPVHTLSHAEAFLGTGVYALYYTGHNPHYHRYAELNRLAYNLSHLRWQSCPQRMATIADIRQRNQPVSRTVQPPERT